MSNPLVSVIVPTKNSGQFLEACLQSIKAQTYKNIELIIVDNFSTDNTQEIAKKYADKVLAKGPERSAQRNFGSEHSKGEFLLFIDSDMELSKKVVEECVKEAYAGAAGLIIPEESFGIGFWAQCKKLERSFYVGVDWMEAARFFKKEIFDKVGGYNEQMVSGEDWDLSQRVEVLMEKICRINEFIYHNEGQLRLSELLKKKYYYAKQFTIYRKNNENNRNLKKQMGGVRRFSLFLKHPTKLLKNPFYGIGMFFMKICEFVVGGIGYALNNRNSS
jgi:glycosyltransferase involved in cell wall biosynthesis